ncbi:response regulator [Pontibacter silvestris]|uniref:Response regulator n=1 Tax=Pontibacter silvestris TaxID=2305183 RepID=A0ABW4WYW1_9BACT|nr:response regulator [Pontibacter silvestris]MCC9138742.1 response regulator [Pontibacter silvestris]
MAKLKVLLMDREPNVIMRLELLMRKNGYEVFIARNSYEAIQCMQKKLRDLAILDMIMSEAGEVCQYISKVRKTLAMNVILLDAKTDDAAIEKGG